VTRRTNLERLSQIHINKQHEAMLAGIFSIRG
jgi:hypothetical protein